MLRDDFISDNLVNMRERLRRNYEKFQAQQAKNGNEAAAEAEDSQVAAGSAAVSEPPIVSVQAVETGRIVPPKTPVVANVDSRERRELMGRIYRDAAFVESALHSLENKMAAAGDFKRVLENISGELDSCDTGKKLDELSSIYFRAYGRFDAEYGLHDNAVMPNMPAVPESNRRNSFVTGMALLISALTISLTMIFLFA